MDEKVRERLSIALALTEQSWTNLGLGGDPRTAASNDLSLVAERVTCLMLVRLIAATSPLGTFKDIGTTTVCVSLLNKPSLWPSHLSSGAVEQMEAYCFKILSGYKDVPYHNFQHAFHVVLSTNKLLDMMLSSRKITYGLKHDPLRLFAAMFAALLHDVEHQGIPNRQLAVEDDRLAVLYNDQSIAEQWSLYIAFSEFLQSDYVEFRETLFQGPPVSSFENAEEQPNPEDSYRQFRKTVIDLVLMTDIASPERTQIGKSKWKEAFGEPFETVDAKVRRQARRMSLTGQNIEVGRDTQRYSSNKRGSMVSALGDYPENDEEDSLSATPENSLHEDQDDILTETKGYYPVNRSASLPENFERRVQRRATGDTTGTSVSRYRQRLGILRTVDLSGETLETYSTHYRRGSMAFSLDSASAHGLPAQVDLEADQPNELKANVVLEVTLTAADVAHNLQGWDQMVTWSTRLYLELRKAYKTDRGMDPSPRWFENQIGFLESYLLPLARRLEDTNVFKLPFAPIVEANRDKWLTHGFDVAKATISEGQSKYPDN